MCIRDRVYAEAFTDSAEMAIADLNAGQDTHTFSLVEGDSGCDGTTAATAADSLISAGVAGIAGAACSGATLGAIEVAKALDVELIEWHIKSTTKAKQGLYEYDAVSRLRDSQLGDGRVGDIGNYIRPGKLWEAFTSTEQVVLLIDEIDKADIEFPNDLFCIV